MRRLKRVDVWAPGVHDSRGGIQEYSRRLVEALAYVRPDARLRLFVKNDAVADPDLEKRGVDVVPCRSQDRGASTFGFAARLLAATAADRPDLVVATHANFSPLAAALRRFFRIPFMVSAHGFEVWGLENGEVARALTMAERILPVGQHTASRLKQDAPGLERISVLHNTVDDTRFSPGPRPRALAARFGIGAADRVLLTINRFPAGEPYCGYDVTLDAFEKLHPQHPNLHWIIGGDGADRLRFAEEVGRRGLADRVHLPGFVPDDDLPDFYRLCDLFVMPSRLEGFGIVYLEAMACGKPALGGNADGAVDALANGRLGLLVDPDDPSAVASAIDRFLRNEDGHALLRDPRQLRDAMLSSFGPSAFRRRLDAILRGFEETRD